VFLGGDAPAMTRAAPVGHIRAMDRAPSRSSFPGLGCSVFTIGDVPATTRAAPARWAIHMPRHESRAVIVIKARLFTGGDAPAMTRVAPVGHILQLLAT